MSNLIPERRMDRHGRLVTRHVRTGPKTTASSALSSAPAVGAAAPISSRNLDSMPESRVLSMTDQVIAAADDPALLWENFDSLQALVESKHAHAVHEPIVRSQVVAQLRDTWAGMHDVSFEPGDYDYMLVGGDEGYKAYWDASHQLTTALNDIETEKARGWSDNSASESDAGAFREASPLAGIEERLGEEAPVFSPKIDAMMDRLDPAVEAVGAVADSVLDRHQGELPEDGTVTSWSDLNPFKRFGRQK